MPSSAYYRQYRRDHPEKYRLANATYALKHPEAARIRHLRRAYNLTIDEWNTLFLLQGSACAACGSCDPGSKRGWHTDHDHITKKVRGILCHSCNVTAHSKITPRHLRLLAIYLERHQ